MSRPALPRASSATSGFFFCGMIEDPVDQASSSLAKPNSTVDHRMTSSLIRERSTPIIASTKAASATRSRAAVPSIELGTEPSNPSSDATNSGSRPSDVPARAAEPYGERARRGVQVAQPVQVAQQRPRVRQQVVAQQDRLGRLQVGASGHRDAEVHPGLTRERRDDVGDAGRHHAQLLAQVGADERGDLVVAGAAGAQPPAQLVAGALHRGRARARRARPHRLGAAANAPEATSASRRSSASCIGGELVVGEQARPVQRPGVRARTGDVEVGEAPVELGGLRQGEQRLGGPALEPAAPQASLASLGHASLSFWPAHASISSISGVPPGGRG